MSLTDVQKAYVDAVVAHVKDECYDGRYNGTSWWELQDREDSASSPSTAASAACRPGRSRSARSRSC